MYDGSADGGGRYAQEPVWQAIGARRCCGQLIQQFENLEFMDTRAPLDAAREFLDRLDIVWVRRDSCIVRVKQVGIVARTWSMCRLLGITSCPIDTWQQFICVFAWF